MKKLLIALLTITTLFSNEEQFSISDYLKDNFLKYSTAEHTLFATQSDWRSFDATTITF